MEMMMGRGAIGGRRRGSEALEVGDSGSESQRTGITPPAAKTLGPVNLFLRLPRSLPLLASAVPHASYAGSRPSAQPHRYNLSPHLVFCTYSLL